MVAGNSIIDYKESLAEASMPQFKVTLGVLSMDKAGFITWPSDFDQIAKAGLRRQARALLKEMIEDPLNPVDDSWAPALTGMGGATRAIPPRRKPMRAGETWTETA